MLYSTGLMIVSFLPMFMFESNFANAAPPPHHLLKAIPPPPLTPDDGSASNAIDIVYTPAQVAGAIVPVGVNVPAAPPPAGAEMLTLHDLKAAHEHGHAEPRENEVSKRDVGISPVNDAAPPDAQMSWIRPTRTDRLAHWFDPPLCELDHKGGFDCSGRTDEEKLVVRLPLDRVGFGKKPKVVKSFWDWKMRWKREETERKRPDNVDICETEASGFPTHIRELREQEFSFFQSHVGLCQEGNPDAAWQPCCCPFGIIHPDGPPFPSAWGVGTEAEIGAKYKFVRLGFEGEDRESERRRGLLLKMGRICMEGEGGIGVVEGCKVGNILVLKGSPNGGKACEEQRKKISEDKVQDSNSDQGHGEALGRGAPKLPRSPLHLPRYAYPPAPLSQHPIYNQADTEDVSEPRTMLMVACLIVGVFCAITSITCLWHWVRVRRGDFYRRDASDHSSGPCSFFGPGRGEFEKRRLTRANSAGQAERFIWEAGADRDRDRNRRQGVEYLRLDEREILDRSGGLTDGIERFQSLSKAATNSMVIGGGALTPLMNDTGAGSGTMLGVASDSLRRLSRSSPASAADMDELDMKARVVEKHITSTSSNQHNTATSIWKKDTDGNISSLDGQGGFEIIGGGKSTISASGSDIFEREGSVNSMFRNKSARTSFKVAGDSTADAYGMIEGHEASKLVKRNHFRSNTLGVRMGMGRGRGLLVRWGLPDGMGIEKEVEWSEDEKSGSTGLRNSANVFLDGHGEWNGVPQRAGVGHGGYESVQSQLGTVSMRGGILESSRVLRGLAGTGTERPRKPLGNGNSGAGVKSLRDEQGVIDRQLNLGLLRSGKRG